MILRRERLQFGLAVMTLTVMACTETPGLSVVVDSGASGTDADLDGATVIEDANTPGEVNSPDTPGGTEDTSPDVVTACVDDDQDGFPAVECGGMPADCDDRNERVNPGRTEVCDRADLDEDCNPCTVAGAADGDGDTDTFTSETCANTYRGSTPVCSSAVRVRSGRVAGTDCDDSDANVRPSQTEACNNRDDNCNGMVDEEVASANWYLDRDGDGHAGRAEMGVMACAAPSPRHVRVNDDCDDTDPLVAPSAPEVCDGAMRDENCNGMQNEGCDCAPVGVSRMCCEGRGSQTCTTSPTGATWSACSATSTTEVCDNVDNDCDGATDEGLRVTCYRDADGDGFSPMGAAAESLCPPGSMAGMCPNGFTTRAPTSMTTSDCDDATSIARSRFPGNREVCNNIDDNCSGVVDEGCGCTVGAMRACYGGPTGTQGVGQCRGGMQRCDATSGGGAVWGACNGEVRPGTETRCNGADENCNGNGDDVPTGTCYTGPSGTAGRGVCRSGIWTCSSGAQVCFGERTPDPRESCNGADDNCNGFADDGLTCAQGSSRTQTGYFNDRQVLCAQNCLSGCNGFESNCPAGSQSMTVRGHITGFWSYNPAVSTPRSAEQDMIKCGISTGYMLYGPYRRFSPGRYQLSWSGRADSVILDFDIRNADTGATLSVASVNRGLGGTSYTASNTVDVPRSWGNASLEFRAFYRNGSNAFACSTVESFTISLVNNVFTL
jgi:hypothetical protein